MGYIQTLLRFFSLETGSSVWPSINRIQTLTILNSAKIPGPDWTLHLETRGWLCKLPLPSRLHSLTKLRIKINLNTLEIKFVLNHRPIAPESFQKARRYKHTFPSEKPRGIPGHRMELSVHSAVLQDAFVVNYTALNSEGDYDHVTSLCLGA